VIDDLAGARRLVRLGVDGITDDPRRLRESLSL
jgi:hypothetical protein